jgi:hypothetical protein
VLILELRKGFVPRCFFNVSKIEDVCNLYTDNIRDCLLYQAKKLRLHKVTFFLSFLFIYRTDIVPKVTIFFYKYTKHKNIAVVLDHEEHKIT